MASNTAYGKVDRTTKKKKASYDVPKVTPNKPSQDSDFFPIRGATVSDLPGSGLLKRAGEAIVKRKKKTASY